MGTSRNPAEFAAKLARLPDAVKRAEKAGVRAAALAATTIIRQNVNAVVPGGKLRGVGKAGAKVGVGFDVKGTNNPTALVSARGPLQLVESPTKPHVEPKPGGKRRKALRLADGQVRARVQHPGTKGQKPFAKGRERAIVPAALAFNAEVRSTIRKVIR